MDKTNYKEGFSCVLFKCIIKVGFIPLHLVLSSFFLSLVTFDFMVSYDNILIFIV